MKTKGFETSPKKQQVTTMIDGTQKKGPSIFTTKDTIGQK